MPEEKNYQEYLEKNVKEIFTELAISILKEKPKNVYSFIADWCLNKEQEGENKKEEQITDESEEEYIDENCEKIQNLKGKMSVAKNRAGISGEVFNQAEAQNFVPNIFEKTKEQNELIKQTLLKSFIFNSLDDKQQDIVISAMEVKKFVSGDYVIKQGDDGKELFIVGFGDLKCTKKIENNEEEIFLKNYKPGEVFGELALLYNAPRAATILSESDSELYSLDREVFNNIVKVAVMKQRERHESFLNRIDFLIDLSEGEKAKICDCLITERFKKGDTIIKEGDPGDKFYLIESGHAEALKKDDKGNESKVFEYSDNDYFGELALLSNDPRQASVRVTSDSMVVASMDRDSFNRLLGSVKSRLQKNVNRYKNLTN